MSALRIALIASSRYPVTQPFAGGLEAHVWHLATMSRFSPGMVRIRNSLAS
jgi:hypothetical protein